MKTTELQLPHLASLTSTSCSLCEDGGNPDQLLQHAQTPTPSTREKVGNNSLTCPAQRPCLHEVPQQHNTPFCWVTARPKAGEGMPA